MFHRFTSIRKREDIDVYKRQDEGSNTWKTCYDSGKLNIPNMEKLGIYHIDDMGYGNQDQAAEGCYGRLYERDVYKRQSMENALFHN